MFLPTLLISHGSREHLNNAFSTFNMSFLSTVVQCLMQASGNCGDALRLSPVVEEGEWGEVSSHLPR